MYLAGSWRLRAVICGLLRLLSFVEILLVKVLVELQVPIAETFHEGFHLTACCPEMVRDVLHEG